MQYATAQARFTAIAALVAAGQELWECPTPKFFYKAEAIAMISQKEAERLGFRIEFDEERGTYVVSSDGKTWRSGPIYNDIKTVKKHKLGHFYVNQVLKPQLAEGESLCHACANAGKVGIVRYAGRVSGREAACVIRYDEDGEPYTVDEYFGVQYDQWKCTSCGYLADSEYA